MLIEILGMVATCFVIVTFLQNGELHIRIADAIGDILFIIYALFIHSPSVLILNIFLLVIQFIKIYKLRKEK